MHTFEEENSNFCYGQYEQLMGCSTAMEIGLLTRVKNRLFSGISNLLWRLKSKGVRETIKYSVWKFLKLNKNDDRHIDQSSNKEMLNDEENLNLQPGELVEVRSEEEIIATLDRNRTLKGLGLMSGMNRHFGKQYRVFKRLETMILESTREYRRVKNTVLLEGVMCDGKAFNGCGRSCFFYWREAWLKRVEENKH